MLTVGGAIRRRRDVHRGDLVRVFVIQKNMWRNWRITEPVCNPAQVYCYNLHGGPRVFWSSKKRRWQTCKPGLEKLYGSKENKIDRETKTGGF